MPERAPGAGLAAAGLRRLTGAMRALVDAGRLPGALMWIERRGVVGYQQALGLQDPARTLPMRSDAIFRIHSMTKPVVSVAAMMLVERGRLQLGDPVAKHLPEFAHVRVGVEADGVLTPVEPTSAMTVQDLLRHTAGLTYEFFEATPVRRQYIDAGLSSRQRSSADFCATLARLPLMYQPGARWEYSRATDVLGRLVEVVSGDALGVHLQRAIFAPLGMVDTGFAVPTGQQQRIAEAFAVDPDTGAAASAPDVRIAAVFESGGDGLVSTLADYARFAQMLVRGGSLGAVRLLGRKTLEHMASDHLDDTVVRDSLPPGYGFGLGFAVRTGAGVSALPGSVGSYGWSGSAGTLFIVDPAEELAAVLMVQAPGQAEEVRALFQTLVYAALDG